MDITQEYIESLHRMVKTLNERMDVLSARISDLNKIITKKEVKKDD